MAGRSLPRHADEMDPVQLPTLRDIREAHARIGPYAHRTPVVRSATLDRAVGGRVFLKCENFQRVGAFKFRGACNAVFSLDEEAAARGVATHSSGNHGQALALAARLRGIPATVVMPTDAPRVKKQAVLGYGAKVHECEANIQSREERFREVLRETGAVPIHPYDDPHVIAGQGTAALELLEEVPNLDVILAPVGGGGLLAGTALATKGTNPAIRVIGCEPERVDDAARSHRDHERYPPTGKDTVADGLRTSLGELNYPAILRYVDEIATVTETAIVAATMFLLERTKLVVEPSGAVPVAAVLDPGGGSAAGTLQRDLRVGVILSGGNVDLPSFFVRAKRDGFLAEG